MITSHTTSRDRATGFLADAMAWKPRIRERIGGAALLAFPASGLAYTLSDAVRRDENVLHDGAGA